MRTSAKALVGSALCFVVIASTASERAFAQERRALLGTVVSSDGTALSGATVHCALPSQDHATGRASEHLVAEADARGRFVFKVRPCTEYRVWAIGPTEGDDGARSVTTVVWAASGKLVELRASIVQPESVLQVVGLDAWPDLAPFRVRLFPARLSLDDASLALSGEGTCKLPPFPDESMSVDLLDKNGEVLLSGSVRGSGTMRLKLPPPQQVPLQVLDAAGKPVAGAAIRQWLYAAGPSAGELGVALPPRAVWRKVGMTDADGRLVAHVPGYQPLFAPNSYGQVNFLAEKPGYRASFSGITDKVYWNGKTLEDEVTELRFVLGEAKLRSGRILLDKETPLAQQELLAHLSLRILTANGNGWTRYQMPWALATDGEGRFDVPQNVGLGEWFYLTMHGPQLDARLVPEQQRRQTPMQFVALHPRKVYGQDPLEIDLSQLHPLELRFSTTQGTPAGNTSVMLLSANSKFDVDAMLPRAITDIAGNVSLLVEPGEWHLFARRGATMYSERLNVTGNLARTPSLVPMPTMRGRVVDAKGNAVAGAQLDCRSASYESGANNDEAEKRIANSCNWNWIREARTDANGEFVCSWLDLPGMSYQAEFRLGDRKSDRFQLRPEDGHTFKL